MWDKIWSFIVSRLEEKSTWIGIAAMATAVGTWVSGSGHDWEQLALLLFGAVAGVTPDSKGK